jgi:NAD(P)-dependent dehydrogenase (short-subunit alcohol dehydrogenase family)
MTDPSRSGEPNGRPAPAGAGTGAQDAQHDEDKIALITGATSGIGYHTARELAMRGTTVLITGRDPQRGADAVAAIGAAAGHSRVHFLPADHATVGANQQLAPSVLGQLAQHGLPQRIDVLVNNVGAIFGARTFTADGYEASLAVNFLAPYVLTRSLLPMLEASRSARCVNVASSASWLARQVRGDLLEDLESSHDYVGIRAHGRAKLLLLAWTTALARQLRGDRIGVAAVNPGMAWTSMTRSLTPEVVPAWRYVFPVVRLFQRRADPAKAAQVCVRAACAASAADINGRYFTERGKQGKLPASVLDPSLQRRLLTKAEELELRAPTSTS